VDQLQNGRLYTNVTLFSREVDVSVIARKYGGGGHAGASGFSFPRDKSPFPDESVVKWE
jgi:nanoRNase/pAp phosphatase (c-di-AMP/oligoRNAs hydrolase)